MLSYKKSRMLFLATMVTRTRTMVVGTAVVVVLAEIVVVEILVVVETVVEETIVDVEAHLSQDSVDDGVKLVMLLVFLVVYIATTVEVTNTNSVMDCVRKTSSCCAVGDRSNRRYNPEMYGL